jgi:hypothetical protein
MFILKQYPFGSSVDHDFTTVTLLICDEDEDAGPI